jgi:hypothetical protein
VSDGEQSAAAVAEVSAGPAPATAEAMAPDEAAAALEPGQE